MHLYLIQYVLQYPSAYRPTVIYIYLHLYLYLFYIFNLLFVILYIRLIWIINILLLLQWVYSRYHDLTGVYIQVISKRLIRTPWWRSGMHSAAVHMIASSNPGESQLVNCGLIK